MNPPKTIFTAQSLSCSRAQRRLFKGLSFSLSAGEVLQITGPNAVGKSSLLRILSGLLQQESGAFQCSVKIFYLGHELGLKKAFTLEENLKFDFRYSMPDQEKIYSLLNKAGLSDCVGKQTAELSQGQQQRLALAKCLLSDAPLWILDEPFVALDTNAREDWQQKIIKHAKQGGAVIISSHMPLTMPTVALKQLELLPC